MGSSISWIEKGDRTPSALECGEKLMKNARKRSELRDEYNVIGMEAAGTMYCVPVEII